MIDTTLLLFQLPLVMTWLLLLLFCGYIFFKTPQKYYVKFLMVPAILIACVYSYLSFNIMLGKAYPHKLDEKVLFIDYHVVIQGGKKSGIEVWVINAKKHTRLYLVPYTEPLEQAFKAAKAASNGGAQVVIEPSKKSNDKSPKSTGKSGEANEELPSLPYKFRALRPDEIMPPKIAPDKGDSHP